MTRGTQINWTRWLKTSTCYHKGEPRGNLNFKKEISVLQTPVKFVSLPPTSVSLFESHPSALCEGNDAAVETQRFNVSDRIRVEALPCSKTHSEEVQLCSHTQGLNDEIKQWSCGSWKEGWESHVWWQPECFLQTLVFHSGGYRERWTVLNRELFEGKGNNSESASGVLWKYLSPSLFLTWSKLTWMSLDVLMLNSWSLVETNTNPQKGLAILLLKHS